MRTALNLLIDFSGSIAVQFHLEHLEFFFLCKIIFLLKVDSYKKPFLKSAHKDLLLCYRQFNASIINR